MYLLNFVTRAQRFAPSRPEPIHTSMLRVLILEDRPDDALLVAEHLRRAGLAFAWERVDTEAAFAAKLESGLDLILADYSLPQFSAPRALDMLKERDLDIPLILVSGAGGEDAAVAVMRGGAHDYVSEGSQDKGDSEVPLLQHARRPRGTELGQAVVGEDQVQPRL